MMETLLAPARPSTNRQLSQVVPRLLGAAFLAVIATSITGGFLLDSALGSGEGTDLLQHLSGRVTMARAGALVDLVTSIGIVALAVLLYMVLRGHGRVVALVAFGCWLLEAMFMAVSRLGALGLVQLSRNFIDAGSPTQSAYQVLGESLYKSIYTQSYTVHMLFYCIGGLIWYGLFYRSRTVPRLIALWGIVAAAAGLGGIVAELLGSSVPTPVYLPLLGFELAVGIWLVVRGISDQPEQSAA